MIRAEKARQTALRRCRYLIKQLGSTAALVDKLTDYDLSESWVRKFLSRHTKNPTINHLDKLLAALECIEAGDSGE